MVLCSLLFSVIMILWSCLKCILKYLEIKLYEVYNLFLNKFGLGEMDEV